MIELILQAVSDPLNQTQQQLFENLTSATSVLIVAPVVIGAVAIIYTILRLTGKPSEEESEGRLTVEYAEEEEESEPAVAETIAEWSCRYCGSLNSPTDYKCNHCYAPKKAETNAEFIAELKRYKQGMAAQ